LLGGDQDFEQLVATVVGFVEAPALGLDLPLDVRGTAFQQRVWRALDDIPYGTTTTYGALAKLLGDKRATRAVGLANGKNPIPIIVPCHRVLSAKGGTGGFSAPGGTATKLRLLAIEGERLL
jgi:AraC family transcriptional regulator of adaptative response/methylated-DNA-[protein]-cysteine methyltransferase